MKLGSLFDGSGGFPLAGSLCGIEPKWAAEVEPYPIAVTRSRFPSMKHLGDVSKVRGGEIEPVDVITFGSPCQDLSVAGKRRGLKHEANGDEETTRSGLFMEAVRIIREMREATDGEYPSIAVWENVPGAFSSNKGEDFRTVLEEFVKIVEPNAVMPPVPKEGWAYADSYCGNGWSLAYRVFDAQYWGVPQRRRRIHLVLDLGGERAREILFEREGVRGYFAQGRTPWQGIAADAQGGSGAADRAIEGAAEGDGRRQDAVAYSFDALASNSMKSSNPHSGCRRVEVAKTLDTTDPNQCKNQGGIAVLQPIITQAAGFKVGQGEKARSIGYEEERSATLAAEAGGNSVPGTVYCIQGNSIDRADTAGCNGKGWKEDASYTLNTIDRPAVAYAADVKTYQKVTGPLMANSHPGSYTGQDAFSDMLIAGVDCRNMNESPELYPTLQAKTNGGQSLNFTGAVRVCHIVRRLTPTECARLQGFPDRWGDIDKKDSFTPEEYRFWLDVRNTHAAINGRAVKDYTEQQMLRWYSKLHTDSAEYRMWGNGIALPPALYCMQGIKDALERASGTDNEPPSLRDVLEKLGSVRGELSRQQFKTLRGQALSGDMAGAIKGLERLIEAKGRKTNEQGNADRSGSDGH